MKIINIDKLSNYQVDPLRGFLPAQDPLEQLPPYFDTWESVASELSPLLMTGRLRPTLERWTPLDINRLEDERQLQRAMLILCYIGNAYVWGGDKPASVIPRGIAIPWAQIAEKLGRPPISSHASLALYNWRRLDKNGSLDLDNLDTLQIFGGGIDEKWFYLTAVVIEARGAPSLPALVEAQQAVAGDRVDDLAQNLKMIASTLTDIYAIMLRIPEKCDPHIFYHRIRPYVAGWEAPGVIYEGVSETPRVYAGGSAAQSALIQALDAGLGIKHQREETKAFLADMRNYMIPGHRRFIEALEAGPSIRQFVLDRQESHPTLTDLYNECIRGMDQFRKKHIEITVRYILHQAPKDEEAKGTGGTSLVPFLSTARKETQEQLLGWT